MDMFPIKNLLKFQREQRILNKMHAADCYATRSLLSHSGMRFVLKRRRKSAYVNRRIPFIIVPDRHV